MKDFFDRIFYGSIYVAIVLIWLFTVFCTIFFLAAIAFAAPPDDVAVDFAVATMIEGEEPAPGPSPYDCPTCKDTGWIMHGDGHQTKCPNCDLAGLPGGPLDIIRQAKELIRKGNQLADRGKALLDAIQRDGKLTVDIRLPQTSAECPDGKCSIPGSLPKVYTATTREASPGVSCSNGKCSPKRKTNSRMRIYKGWRR